MTTPVTPSYCEACGAVLLPMAQAVGQGAPLLCSGCGRPVYLDPKVAVAVVVEHAERVVLLRRAQRDRAHGLWILPGGHVDRGEVVERAARREVCEETGLQIELNGLLGVYSYPENPWVLIVYRGRSTGGALIGSLEALEIRTFAPQSIPWDELGYQSTHQALADYLDGLSPARSPRGLAPSALA